MIWFDLDGVIRDLCSITFGYEAPAWEHRDKGKGIVKMLNDNLWKLRDAPSFDYIEVAKLFYPVNVITAQRKSWRKYTEEWINKHFKNESVNLVYAKAEEKLSYLGENDFLVEDYPLFEDYSNIILVDRLYNHDVKCKYRVHNKEELKNLLEELNGR